MRQHTLKNGQWARVGGGWWLVVGGGWWWLVVVGGWWWLVVAGGGGLVK
jgi:hypothetical protein